jgi:hypothetical protein
VAAYTSGSSNFKNSSNQASPLVQTVNPSPSVSVAFGPFGEVLEVVNPNGILTQFDVFGAHVVSGGVRFASVAFGPFGEVLLVTSQNGILAQYDILGAHVLGGGVLSASIAFGPFGEVVDVVSFNGTLTQYDALGAHVLGRGVLSAGIAFGPFGQGDVSTQDGHDEHSVNHRRSPTFGEVIDVITQDGTLIQYGCGAPLVFGKVF